MNKDEATLLMVKGLISEMPEDVRAQTETCIAAIRGLFAEYGDAAALTAVTLVVSEYQAKGRPV